MNVVEEGGERIPEVEDMQASDMGLYEPGPIISQSLIREMLMGPTLYLLNYFRLLMNSGERQSLP